MFPLEQVIDKQLRDVKGSNPTLIFPEARDARIIEAVSGLVQFAKIVLLATEEEVSRIIEEESIPLKVSKTRFLQSVAFVVPNENPALQKQFAAELVVASKGRSWEMDLAEADKWVSKETYFAIMSVRMGYADAVLGGLQHSSLDFFRPCLRLLKRDGTVYEMSLFALPDSHASGFFEQNLVMFADVALNPEPSPERLADITVGACLTLRNIIPVEDLPQVNGALLSYSTRGSGEGPSVDRIRDAEPFIEKKLAEICAQNDICESINIATELQIGCAISKEAARTKLGEMADSNPAIGEANVLIAPSLDTGNLLYHIYSTRYPDAKAILVIGGLRNQALDFSRGSKTEDVVLGAKTLILRMHRSGRFKFTPNDTFFPRYKILTINPLHESTGVTIWNGRDLGVSRIIQHPKSLFRKAPLAQVASRKAAIAEFLEDQGVDPGSFDAVVGRCGLLRPVESGTYEVDQHMIHELKSGVHGEHIANTGAIIARELAGDAHPNVYVVDPPVVDELDVHARLSGLQGYDRTAIWHALGQKYAVKNYVVSHGLEYRDVNLVVAYLGTGISVGAHLRGKCVQVNNSLYEGPMGPERVGNLNSLDLVELCFSGASKEEILQTLTKRGGVYSYLGTSDFGEIDKRLASGDDFATLVVDSMIQQIASEIAATIPRFRGAPVDQLIVAGPLADYEKIVSKLKESLVGLDLAVTVYPGNLEPEALRDGALRVLRDVEIALAYGSKEVQNI